MYARLLAYLKCRKSTGDLGGLIFGCTNANLGYHRIVNIIRESLKSEIVWTRQATCPMQAYKIMKFLLRGTIKMKVNLVGWRNKFYRNKGKAFLKHFR